MTLSWHRAVTADADHPNVEVEFGDGSWAYVVLEPGGWTWGVLDALNDTAQYLARGREETKDAAVAAVETWAATRAARPAPRSDG